MNVSPRFLDSYSGAANYPQNLLAPSVNASRSKQYCQRLSSPASRLCMNDLSQSTNLQISFRDWVQGDAKCHKLNAFTEDKMAAWLGDESKAPFAGNQVTKRDPSCRFIFLSSPTGRDALQVTTDMLRCVLSYHQVPAQYLDFLFLFGERDSSSDLKFGNFWGQSNFKTPEPDLVLPDLGRSGQQYEMCFNLKGVEPKDVNVDSPTELDQWSIRHAAIYHKFDVVEGTAAWMITKAKWTLKHMFKSATGETSGPAARSFDDLPSSYCSSLAAHILIARWAGESWWPYLQCLENELESKTKSALLVNGDTATWKNDNLPTYNRGHLQEIIFYEEIATQAALVLKTNTSVLKALREFYQCLLEDVDFPLTHDVSSATKSFAAEIHKMETEMENLEARANYLVTHAKNRKGLVLNLMQAQNSDNMTDMTRRSIEEAIVMRIITVVTLVYLPATFVSTFFSTDVVKYQPGGEGETYHTQYSSLAMDRWLQVTLPLTCVTLVIAICLYKWARRPLTKAEQSKV